MRRGLLYVVLVAGGMAVPAGLTLPASAQDTTVTVRTTDGQLVTVTVPSTSTTPLTDIQLPGTTQPSTTVTKPTQPSPSPTQQLTQNKPSSSSGKRQRRTRSRKPARPNAGELPATLPGAAGKKKKRAVNGVKSKLYNRNGSPNPHNPTYFQALPGPAYASGVPNFVIEKFRVPPFLLSIYQAAGIQYGIPWELLAAINEIETDYGRNLNVSSAGAVGWMQFLPSTWRTWGVDANRDGRKDPYNPVDAIFAAARYLKAAGGGKDLRRAIFAYNHADWYVDAVLLRMKLLQGVPADLIGSLTGLTEGRFPVYARARYADDVLAREAMRRVHTGSNVAQLDAGDPTRRGINIFARKGAPVLAVNDGVVKRMGFSKRHGRYLVLQDVYGNRYYYFHLGRLARFYPVPKNQESRTKLDAAVLQANKQPKLPRPTAPASAGVQSKHPPKARHSKSHKAAGSDASAPAVSVVSKRRLFANPLRPGARTNGGLEQLAEAQAEADTNGFRAYLARPLALDTKGFRLKMLKRRAHVIGGTILGRIGKTDPLAPHVYFAVRPAGRGAPLIDPKPILDGWKLLEATAIYGPRGRNALYSRAGENLSIGEVMLLPKPLLERRVLNDPRIEIYPCGQEDIRTGQIDRRVLATLEFLADSGLNPTVSALHCGHSKFTTSGNVSEHWFGDAVDISRINGIPITGHQDPGGITEITVKRLMTLQGVMRPHQIISLLDFGGNTMALPDHYNHIHVGFQPLFGTNGALGKAAMAVLKPHQWYDLMSQLRKIQEPRVPTKPSKYAIRVHRHRHVGSGD